MKENELRPIVFTEFADRETLAAALARRVADRLRDAIAARGHGILAVSGGSTPKRFFEALSHEEPGWENVTITLVDERFVPPDSDRSNQKLVTGHLIKNKAARARFVPLFRQAGDVEAAARSAAEHIAALARPFDVAILGMGTDGHTASFFPYGNHLHTALAPEGESAVVSMEAADAGEPRLTLTLPRLVESRMLLLHIEGAEKLEALSMARGAGAVEAMPIRAVLDAAPRPLTVFWAP